jgi:hypothetical protein
LRAPTLFLFCLPDRYSSPNTNQHPKRKILVARLLAADIMVPGLWEDGRTGQTHGVRQLSYPSIQLHRRLLRLGLSTPHLAVLSTGWESHRIMLICRARPPKD